MMQEKDIIIKRFHPSIKKGLSTSQVEDRIKNNLVNYDTVVPTKTISQIISSNVFTLFNFLNFFLGIAVFLVGSYKNLTFLGIVICNTLISIFKEINAKKAIDKLSIISSKKVTAVREGKEVSLSLDEIVLDDILIFKPGNQIITDSILKEGMVEVNEAFITGESNPILKKTGQMLLSGSFVISGVAYAQVEHIGSSNYTSKISSGAKYIKKVNSEIMKSLQKIIKIASFLIVPIGILLFYRQLSITGNTFQDSVVNTVAALIGMIPEGLILLTSTVLAVSVIRLAKSHVLVQELYCIETLARVDVMCLDKTGTITEGCMEVFDLIKLEHSSTDEILNAIGAINKYLHEDNPTALAISNYFSNETDFEVSKKYFFSSSKKYSGIYVKNKGYYFIGAPEILLKNNEEKYKEQLREYSKEYRVLLLCFSKDEQFTDVSSKAFILLRDKIRKEAKDTIQYFKEQKVAIKIISGDSKETVYNIAKRAGLNLKAIDASDLLNQEDIDQAVLNYDIFARVTPLQKKEFIRALRKHGHTVAMIGDGVNDVLALKEADCSVAMASGSDAARNVSQLVLLKSDFSSMPKVVLEGRRTINNIQRSASLFLVKTIYATILAILFLFIASPYPFIPIQLTLTSVVTIGIPSFILALEPNKERIKGQFFKNVISNAMPASLTIVINILLVMFLASIFKLVQIEVSTLSIIMIGYTGFVLLFKICYPFNRLRLILYVCMFVLFVVGIFLFPNLFSLTRVNLKLVSMLFVLMYITLYIYKMLSNLITIFLNKKDTI